MVWGGSCLVHIYLSIAGQALLSHNNNKFAAMRILMTRDITGGVARDLRLMGIIAMGTENREADEGI